MRSSVKASTLMETVVATLIIVISFMALMTITVQVRKRASGYSQYWEMRSSRDSVVVALTEGADVPVLIERHWGTLMAETDADGVACIQVQFASGQNYTVYYLLDNGNNE